MSDKSLFEHLPPHFRRWIRLVQRLPLVVMTLFTLSIVFDNASPIGTMMVFRRWGFSHAGLIIICVTATLYLAFATRQMTFQGVMHFLLGSFPLLLYITVSVSRIFYEDFPIPAAMIYIFAYAGMAVFYWLAVGLAEWELRLSLQERAEL